MTMILREYSNIRVFSSSSSSRFLPIFDLEEDDDDSAQQISNERFLLSLKFIIRTFDAWLDRSAENGTMMKGGKKEAGIVRRANKYGLVATKPTDNDFTRLASACRVP